MFLRKLTKKIIVYKKKNYNLLVGFPTTTINEFRNNHCGRGGVPTTSTIKIYGGELDRG